MRCVGIGVGVAAVIVSYSASVRAQDIGGIYYWIGQDLQVTVESDANNPMPAHDLNTLKDLFAALRACWTPPSVNAASRGMQMAVRLSFKRNGEMVAAPRLTYALAGSLEDVRKRYRESIDAALQRCAPLKLTPGLGGAIAGRPIAIRYVENRALTHAPQASVRPPRDPKLEGLNF